MAFLPKEELYAKARELGIQTEGVKFAKLQGLVSKALAGTKVMESPNKGNNYKLDLDTHKKVVGTAHIVGHQKPKPEDYISERQIFSPEMKLKAHQFFGYDEVVGDQPRELTDPFTDMRMALGTGTLTSDTNTEVSRSVAIKSKTGKKVVATVGMPHGNAEIYYEPDAPAGLFSARFGNVDGYIWSNQSPITIYDPHNRSKFIRINIRGVKDVLEELDRFTEWAPKCEPYQSYAFNIRVVDKSFVRHMLRVIIMDIKKEKKLNES